MARRVAIFSLMLLFFGLSSEARARLIDEAPWPKQERRELRAASSASSPAARAIASNKGLKESFFDGAEPGVEANYQCGSRHCLLRVIDQKNGVICYAASSANLAGNLTCLPLK